MSRAADVPVIAQRALVALIVLYFAVAIYAAWSGDPNAALAADATFGVVSLSIGWLLFRQSPPGFSASTAAAACFAAGGLAQLGALLIDEVLLELVTTAAVVAGIVLYVIAIRRGG